MFLVVIKFLPLVIFGLIFLFGGHYFIYRSLVDIFNIANPLLKVSLAVFFLIMSVGFFGAAFIAHASQNQLTRSIYIITASWLGLAINLLLAALLTKLAVWLANLTGLNFDLQLVGAVIFFLALLWSAYGFWNAQHPQVKKMEVVIKNLPLSWQGKTVIQLSDIHLGHVHGVDFLQSIIEQTNAHDPDLVLIVGDLFDGMDGDLSVFTKPLNSLKAKKGVFFVTGNHEAYVGLDKALAILRQTDIRVLSNEMVDVDGLQIIGFSYPAGLDTSNIIGGSNNTANIIASLGLDKNKPSISMHHAPTDLAQARAAGIGLQLSGHTHNGQIWPFNLITGFIYGRYDYGLNSEGDFSVYTTNGIGTWGPPMRTGNTPEIPVFKLR